MDNTPTPVETEEYNNAVEELTRKYQDGILAIENGQEIDKEYVQKLENARANNKKIFLFFQLKGCAGCTALKYVIKYDEAIKAELLNYEVLVADMSKARTKLSQKYNLYSYPACFVIDSNETIVKKNMGCAVVGGVANNFLNWLKS